MISTALLWARCSLAIAFGLYLVQLFAVAATSPARAQSVSAIVEIGPRQSNHPDDPNAASGGRVNGIAVDPNDNAIMYAASEWGGLFKSTDGGRTWAHLSGHVPHATWDIAVDPANSSRIYATSFYDGRVDSIAGISVSKDGGVTWLKPATAVPPDGSSCEHPEDRDQPHAFGIAIDPAQPAHVFVGTNCGLAASDDSGATWRFIDPTPGDSADYVWDVVVHDGGIIDLCGDDGHQRSIDGGATWTSVSPDGLPLPSGRCSLAVSPDESYVLFAVVGDEIYDSVDGGLTWAQTYQNEDPQGRIPFVAVNKRAAVGYDLWFGDVGLFRRSCTTPSPPPSGGAPRCPGGWSEDFSKPAGAHNDVGDILFASAGPDACPLLFSNDGGIYFNTKTTSPDCHSPRWQQPDRTPQAQWNMDMVGLKDEASGKVFLYYGNQDTGTFGTTDAGVEEPSWNNLSCCDGFGMAAEQSRVLSAVCCFSPGRQVKLFLSQPGLVGETEVNTYPSDFGIRGFDQLDSLHNFGPDDYVVLTYGGAFVTTDIAANPIVWTRLGGESAPENPCGVQVSFRGTTPVFYVLSDPAETRRCSGEDGRALWRYEGAGAGGTWSQVAPDGRKFGVYAVDPNDPDRIIAADLTTDALRMVMTTDGGATWSDLASLDALMTGNGAFRYRVARGPSRGTEFKSYPQPTLVAFDPKNRDVIVAGAADAGVFISHDSGATWRPLTNPIDPGVTGTPHIPRPRYAFFDHREGDRLRLFLGTMGRGQWRIELEGVPREQEITMSAPGSARPAGARSKGTQRDGAPTRATLTEPGSAGFDGQWQMVDGGGALEIKGNEWRHPAMGIADLLKGRGSANYEVQYRYHRGAMCAYRIKKTSDGQSLILEPTDATQPIDFCPSGILPKVGS